jgi:hypothetical protein
VSKEDGRNLANAWKAQFVELSAMDINVRIGKTLFFFKSTKC